MERSFMKKTMNIFFCALLGAAVLIGGCSDNNKAEAVKEQKTAAAAQKEGIPLTSSVLYPSLSTICCIYENVE